MDLHEWLGNGWGLLFSHPAPFTPICTSEVGALAKAHKVSGKVQIFQDSHKNFKKKSPTLDLTDHNSCSNLKLELVGMSFVLT